MKIVLMRHGRPEMDLEAMLKQKVSASDVGHIVKDYEKSGLSKDSAPSVSAVQEIKAAGIVISSDLPRAVQSVERLGGQDKLLIDKVFRESRLPYVRATWPRLSLYSYLLFFRLAWLLGFSANGEPLKIARQRAAHGAVTLQDMAKSHGSVVLLGHGVLNRLIARELKKSGWRCAVRGDEGYWSFTVFTH